MILKYDTAGAAAIASSKHEVRHTESQCPALICMLVCICRQCSCSAQQPRPQAAARCCCGPFQPRTLPAAASTSCVQWPSAVLHRADEKRHRQAPHVSCEAYSKPCSIALRLQHRQQQDHCSDCICSSRWCTGGTGGFSSQMCVLLLFACSYRFHLEMPNGGYQFLLSARKRVKTTTSSYVISNSPDDLGRHSKSCIAKLRSNFVGTGFSIFLTGSSGSANNSRPQSGAFSGRQGSLQQQQLASTSTGGFSPLQAGQAGSHQQRSFGGSSSRASSGRTTQEDVSTAWQAAGVPSGKQEVGAVQYEYNVLGTRGPRKLSVAVPHIDEAGNVLWAPSGPQDSIAERLK